MAAEWRSIIYYGACAGCLLTKGTCGTLMPALLFSDGFAVTRSRALRGGRVGLSRTDLRIFSAKIFCTALRAGNTRKYGQSCVCRDVFLSKRSFSCGLTEANRVHGFILGEAAGCVAGFSMLEAAPTHACGEIQPEAESCMWNAGAHRRKEPKEWWPRA